MESTLPTIETNIIDLVWSRRDKLIDLADKSFRSSESGKLFSYQEVENWIDGFIVVLLEALQNQKTAYRRFFLERMLSDIIAGGIHPQLMLQMSIAWSILVSNEFVLLVPAHMQNATTRWFSSFFAGYTSELVSVLQTIPAEHSHTAEHH